MAGRHKRRTRLLSLLTGTTDQLLEACCILLQRWALCRTEHGVWSIARNGQCYVGVPWRHAEVCIQFLEYDVSEGQREIPKSLPGLSRHVAEMLSQIDLQHASELQHHRPRSSSENRVFASCYEKCRVGVHSCCEEGGVCTWNVSSARLKNAQPMPGLSGSPKIPPATMQTATEFCDPVGPTPDCKRR